MINLDSILKSRDITLPTNICLVKAMVFSAVMYGCESWTRKKAERRRINAFELWCLRLLTVSWNARRSNQSVLKTSHGYSLEGLIVKLILQNFSYLMQRTDSFEKTLMLGKIEGMRRGWQRMRWLDGITNSTDISLSKLPEFTQTHNHWAGDAIQSSHPLSSPSPPALNLSQYQGLFKWVSSLHQVAKGLDLSIRKNCHWT